MPHAAQFTREETDRVWQSGTEYFRQNNSIARLARWEQAHDRSKTPRAHSNRKTLETTDFKGTPYFFVDGTIPEATNRHGNPLAQLRHRANHDHKLVFLCKVSSVRDTGIHRLTSLP